MRGHEERVVDREEGTAGRAGKRGLVGKDYLQGRAVDRGQSSAGCVPDRGIGSTQDCHGPPRGGCKRKKNVEERQVARGMGRDEEYSVLRLLRSRVTPCGILLSC